MGSTLSSSVLLLTNFFSFLGPSGSGKSQVRHQRLLSSSIHFLTDLAKQIIDALTGQRGTRAHSRLEVINKSIVAYRVLNHERFASRLVLIEAPAIDYTGVNEVIDMLLEFLPTRYVLSLA